MPGVRDGLPAGAGSPDPGAETVLIWVRRRFKGGEYGGAHVDRRTEFERKFTMRTARPDVGYAPRTEQSRPGQVLPGPPPDHLSPPECNHQARTNQAPPIGHTQEIKPIPRKTHPRPGRNPPPRPPKTHPQTLCQPFRPKPKPPVHRAPTPRQKGAPSGETTPNPKSGRWRGMEAHPPRGSNRRPKTEVARGSKRPCIRWRRRGVGGISNSRAA